MSDGMTECFRDPEFRREAEQSTTMVRCGGVVIFFHRSLTLQDCLTALKVLTSRSEECLHQQQSL